MNVHSYFVKGNKYISTNNSQCFTEVNDLMLANTHCSAGPATHCPDPEHYSLDICSIEFTIKKHFGYKYQCCIC